MSILTKSRRRARRTVPALAALTATLAIAACGSSSSTTASTSSSSASAPAGASSANRTALVACLKKHGVTPPAHRPSGTSTNRTGTPPPGGFGGGAGSATRQAAFKACGVTGRLGGGAPATSTTSG